MDYYKFTKKDFEKYYERTVLGTTSKFAKAKKDTTYFSVNSVGIKPLTWQMKLWDLIDEGHKRIAICTPRQVGKSIALALFAFKAASLNIAPAGVAKKTHVGIISATEEQSKKVMAEIKRIIQLADKHVEYCTRGKQKKWFSNQVDKSQGATNNKSTITFTNGNQIICLPPTDRVRGYSFSFVFVDEAAFVESNEIFFDSIEPTVSQTGGTIVLTSTPNGQIGWYFEIFDPFDEYDSHEYKRFWLNYKDLNKNEEIERNIIDNILAKKELYYSTGREKHFEQEYEAKFTTQVSAYFDSEDVDLMFDSGLIKHDVYDGECDLAIDFGMVNSHSVLTISRLSDDDSIERVYHYRYDFGKDDDIIQDVQSLLNRYNVQRIIPDDCPQGYHTIQKMIEKGWNVKPMSFKKDKVKKYSEFRAWLRQRKIKSYKDKVLDHEMKALQEEETVRTTKIHKPSGGTDDEVDCFVMSCYFYLEPKKKTFRVIDVDEFDEDDY